MAMLNMNVFRNFLCNVTWLIQFLLSYAILDSGYNVANFKLLCIVNNNESFYTISCKIKKKLAK